MNISKHTMIRMQERGITGDHLVECIEHGKIVPHKYKEGHWTVLGHKVIIILNPNKDTIITVFPTKGRKHIHD